ncbi:MAG: lysophospholipase L1-like esterase [Myxococcota bacterium]|jgi:lysophospholipase L1-like esterase
MQTKTLLAIGALLIPAGALGITTQVIQLRSANPQIPAQDCNSARSTGLDYAEGVTPSVPPEEPLAVPEVPTSTPPISLPILIDAQGGEITPPVETDPTKLPLQPLEGNPQDIWRVGEVLRRAEAGERVRMTFFGASHTGGDYWTGHIRRVMQSRYGDAGHGFILPAALYRGFRNTDINLCRTDGWRPDYDRAKTSWGDGYLGLGMSVSSTDPADFGWIETTRSNPHGRAVSRYRIFGLMQPEGGTLTAQVDGSPPLTFSTRAESPDLLQAWIDVEPGAHRLTVSPQGDGEVRLFGISAERAGPGVIVDAVGIRGRQAKSWLSWDESLMGQMMTALDPDLVVLAYGTNEAADSDYTMEAYARDLRAVLTRLRESRPHAACVLAGPSDRAIKKSRTTPWVWGRTEPVAQVQREVAPEFGCVFWDWQQATGGPGSMLIWRQYDPPLAAGDYIHFTPSGYIHSAELFIAALDDARSLNLPPR